MSDAVWVAVITVGGGIVGRIVDRALDHYKPARRATPTQRSSLLRTARPGTGLLVGGVVSLIVALALSNFSVFPFSRNVRVTWTSAYPLSGLPNGVPCSCISTIQKGSTFEHPLPEDAYLYVENKCKGDVNMIFSKDLSPPDHGPFASAPGTYYQTSTGRYWAYFKLGPMQHATLQLAGSWGGGSSWLSCND